LCSPEYFVFEIEVKHVYGIIRWLHHEFFSNFFETHKCDLKKTAGAQVPRSQKSLSEVETIPKRELGTKDNFDGSKGALVPENAVVNL
jgi:hypothetical protein